MRGITMGTGLLESLGTDIVESEIIPLLAPDDINSLKLTSRSLYYLVEQSSFVWQELFKKTFGKKPTPYSLNKWPDLYKLRRKGELYAWGTLSGGRLGISTRDSIPPENFVRRGFAIGLTKPSKVPGLNVVLADVSAGGFSFQILTDHGDIFSTASYHAGNDNGPGPDGNDYNELQQLAREHEREQIVRNPPDLNRRILGQSGGNLGRLPPIRLPRTIASLPYVTPGHSREDEEKRKEAIGVTNRSVIWERAVDEDTKFVSVSSGRAHFVALDRSGKIWSWDKGERGVRIGFSDEQRNHEDLEDKGHKVMKVVAGWDSSVAYLYNYGLIYWKKRSALKEGEQKAQAHYFRVPDTSDLKGPKKVIDFIAGDSFLIYLTEDGEIYRNDMIGESSYALNKFTLCLKSRAESSSPKFVRLSGSFRTFAVFSNEDVIFIGSKDNNEPVVYEELNKKGCINVSVGDYHFLALLRDGTLLSWGLESRRCGCLGLGGSTNVDMIQENESIRVRKPTVIPIPEGLKVVAIAAAGWQSSAIITRV